MVKAEPLGPACGGPMAACGLEQGVGAGDVGLDEAARPVDGPIHMAFGGQMHDRIGAMVSQDAVHRGAVANISLFKGIKRAVRHGGQIIEAGGIGQLVDVHDMMPARHRQPHHGRADEPRPTCHEQLHDTPPS